MAIPDMGIPSLPAMRQLIDDLCMASPIVYIHCWGGSGRTGTVAGCYLVNAGHSPAMALS